MNGAPVDLERLGKLLGMLGSDHEGERANAALLADRLVRDSGTTWPALLEPLKGSAGRGSQLPHRRDALACLAVVGIWSPREADFLTNLTRRRRAPSEAQALWLADLLQRAQSHREAA